jgi:hypothetical protein
MYKRWVTPVLALSLFVLNLLVCARLFQREFLVHLFSVEGSYIALTRYVSQNWSDLSWFPLWYCGLPFVNGYQPGLGVAGALLVTGFKLTPGYAYHAALAILYSAGPAGLFLFLLRMSRDRIASLMSALVFSLVSLSAFIVPAIRVDLVGLRYARRFQAAVYYGEGPNVAGLSLAPFALLALHQFYERPTVWRFLLAAIALDCVVLTSWPATVALALAIVAYLLSRQTVPSLRRLLQLAVLAVTSYALIAPWMPISTILTNQRNSQHIEGNYQYTRAHLLYAVALIAVLLAVRYIARRFRLSELLQFALCFSIFTGAITLSFYVSKFALLPQPWRFHLAFEIGLSILLGLLLANLLRIRSLRYPLAAALALFFGAQAVTYRHYASRITQPADGDHLYEHQIAKWLADRMPGKRVFAAGSAHLWINAWEDIPQVTGCCLPGVVNPVAPMAGYVVTTDDGTGDQAAAVSLLWLKALGAEAVIVGGPNTRNAYKAWAHPEKFEGILPVVWREGDDRIYGVPSRASSLAHVVRTQDLARRTPWNGIDLEPLRTYVAALENASLPIADSRWVNHHEMLVHANVGPGQAISIQETYTPGWRATMNGRAATVGKDGLGFMFITPGSAGPAEIRLVFDGGTEMLGLRVLRAAAVLAIIGWIAASLWLTRARGPVAPR